MSWDTAQNASAALADGQCGLSDGSVAEDWSLPTIEEWEATIKSGCTPSLSNTAGTGCHVEGDPFSGVQSDNYWSSATIATPPNRAWVMPLGHGGVTDTDFLTVTNFVWPVRGGN